MLEALGALHADVARQLEGFADDAATFRAAAANARARALESPLLVHGFYEFTGLQRDLVTALAGSRPLFVFLPSYSGDLGDFAHPTRKLLSEILGCKAETPAPVTSRRFPRVPHSSQRFAARETGTELPDDGTLAVVSAADDASEAREAAREVLIGRDQGQAARPDGHPRAPGVGRRAI